MVSDYVIIAVYCICDFPSNQLEETELDYLKDFVRVSLYVCIPALWCAGMCVCISVYLYVFATSYYVYRSVWSTVSYW